MKTLEGEWQITSRLVADKLSQTELQILRATFFGGAAACMELMRKASSESVVSGVEMVQALREEIQDELKRGGGQFNN